MGNLGTYPLQINVGGGTIKVKNYQVNIQKKIKVQRGDPRFGDNSSSGHVSY